MTGFLVRRLIQAVAIVFAVVTLTFFAVRLAPGDPFANDTGQNVSPDFYEAHRARWGLDRPLWGQYLTFLSNVARGDLGRSFQSQRPVIQQIGVAFLNTLVLGIGALLVNFGIGIAVGAGQAMRRGSRFDRVTSFLTLVVLAMPGFWMALLASHFLGSRWGIFPSFGVLNPVIYDQLSLAAKIVHRLYHLCLPAVVLGITSGVWTVRYMRAETLELMHLPHVRTARAKGLSERLTLTRHIARNALIPIVTLFGLSFPTLLSGAVFIEFVFAWHGLGWEAAFAFSNNDYPVITGITIFASALVVLGSLVADILYRVVDPRVQTS